jgi:dihydrofolate synthase/folylpolyglutamate synthase
MRFDTLADWLDWQEKLHFTEVDPGLVRVSAVWQNLTHQQGLPFKVITVAGTNGKGSSVAMLEAILRSAGYKTGTYTSPHLLRYNERMCIDSIPCDDDVICKAFDKIDTARGETSLTYFEFATLAAITIFCDKAIDIAILEVGMGGRLDAVNAFDADFALITPIGLDHTAWLGTTREQIGFEKAGIMRANTPVVSSEVSPPESIVQHAKSLDAPFYHANTDYFVDMGNASWSWCCHDLNLENLPLPALEGQYQIQNAAAVLQVISLLNASGLNVPVDAIKQGLVSVRLAGRFQCITGEIERVFDVTHNQQGAENLANLLKEKSISGNNIAVIAMLKDKDIDAVVTALKSEISHWFCAGLDTPRGMDCDTIRSKLCKDIPLKEITMSKSVVEAYQRAMVFAKPGDRVLTFGSFHTVEEVLLFIEENN